MKTIKKILIVNITALIGTTAVVYAATLAVPVAPALFDTALSAPQATTDTTLTMVTAPNIYSGDYVCVAIDSGLTTLEYECGTASSSPTTIINLQRGLNLRDGSTTISANIFTHRVGSDVRITTFPILTFIEQVFAGVATFPNILSYTASTTIATSTLQIPYAGWVDQDAQYWSNLASTSAQNLSLTGNNIYTGLPSFQGGAAFTVVAPTTSITPTSPLQIPNKSYVDSVALQGAPSGSETATGTIKVATNVQAASSTLSIYPGGARLALTAGISTSTYNPSGSLQVVVTQNNNKIDPNFITQTFSSATLNGTTTITSIASTTDGRGSYPLWTLLGSSTLVTDTGTWTISNIPVRQQLMVFSQIGQATAGAIFMQFNGDVSTAYSWSATSTIAGGPSQTAIQFTGGVSTASSTGVFNIFQLNQKVKFVTGTVANTAASGGSAATFSIYPNVLAASWSTTTPQYINSISFAGVSNIKAGSNILIYGSSF